MEKPDDDILDVFGYTDREKQAEHADYVMTRYSMGESLDDIAQDYNVQSETLRVWMKKYDLSLYRQAKEKAVYHRELRRASKYHRIITLNTDEVLRKLELEPEKIALKEQCQIEKNFGDRLALLQDKPTGYEKRIMEIVDFSNVSELNK